MIFYSLETKYYLISPSLFDIGERDIVNDGIREQRHEGVLLQLIRENGRGGSSVRADGETSRGVTDRDGQTRLYRTLVHGTGEVYNLVWSFTIILSIGISQEPK